MSEFVHNLLSCASAVGAILDFVGFLILLGASHEVDELKENEDAIREQAAVMREAGHNLASRGSVVPGERKQIDFYRGRASVLDERAYHTRLFGVRLKEGAERVALPILVLGSALQILGALS